MVVGSCGRSAGGDKRAISAVRNQSSSATYGRARRTTARCLRGLGPSGTVARARGIRTTRDILVPEIRLLFPPLGILAGENTSNKDKIAKMNERRATLFDYSTYAKCTYIRACGVRVYVRRPPLSCGRLMTSSGVRLCSQRLTLA